MDNDDYIFRQSWKKLAVKKHVSAFRSKGAAAVKDSVQQFETTFKNTLVSIKEIIYLINLRYQYDQSINTCVNSKQK